MSLPARRTNTRFTALVLSVVALACSPASAVAPPAGNTIVKAHAEPATAAAASVETIDALVTDATNQPLAGVLVTFTVTSGGGSIAPATATTAPNGIASAQWTLGAAANTDNRATATVAMASGSPLVYLTHTNAAPAFQLANLTAGEFHACGLAVDVAYCWGSNAHGEIGKGVIDPAPDTRPVAVAGGLHFKAIAAGRNHTCGITLAGATYCWGDKALLGTGVVEPADRPNPSLISSVQFWDAISVGFNSTCAIAATTHFVWCWGNNVFGQLGDGTTTTPLGPVQIASVNTFTAIAVGEQYACGIATAGGVYCWGLNNNGQLGDGSTTQHLTPTLVAGSSTFTVRIATGVRHTCAVDASSHVWCWGIDANGELGDGATTQRLVPVATAAGLAYSAIAAGSGGSNHTCGITSTQLNCWGRNSDGQLGDGTSGIDRLVPTQVAGGGAWLEVVAGNGFSCAANTSHVVSCWGHSSLGSLGDGTTLARLVPTPILPP